MERFMTRRNEQYMESREARPNFEVFPNK
jgi:hypothetical protein